MTSKADIVGLHLKSKQALRAGEISKDLYYFFTIQYAFQTMSQGGSPQEALRLLAHVDSSYFASSFQETAGIDTMFASQAKELARWLVENGHGFGQDDIPVEEAPKGTLN
jgi:hypothetical protein